MRRDGAAFRGRGGRGKGTRAFHGVGVQQVCNDRPRHFIGSPRGVCESLPSVCDALGSGPSPQHHQQKTPPVGTPSFELGAFSPLPWRSEAHRAWSSRHRFTFPAERGLGSLQDRESPCGERSQAPAQPRLFSELWKAPVAVFLEAGRGVGPLYCFTVSRRCQRWI